LLHFNWKKLAFHLAGETLQGPFLGAGGGNSTDVHIGRFPATFFNALQPRLLGLHRPDREKAIS
jgi:hypothetical protein